MINSLKSGDSKNPTWHKKVIKEIDVDPPNDINPNHEKYYINEAWNTPVK